MRINGQPGHALPAADRGLHYGDGLFETLAVTRGEPLLWEAHMARLARGCQHLGIRAPDPELLLHECRSEIDAEQRCVIKLILTRGSGGRGYRPPARPSSTLIVTRYVPPDHPAGWWRDGVRVVRCHTRLAIQPRLAGVKHLNRLEQVLARSEWSDPQIAEGLMCDAEGRPVEGTLSNLFLVRDGRLFTPPLERCGVAGVMRAQVMVLAAERGEPVQEQDITWGHLGEADALFLTNALIGLWPVRSLAGRDYATTGIPRWLRQAVMPLALGPLESIATQA
jgi:4-amino-4-deoxychorismate lyase